MKIVKFPELSYGFMENFLYIKGPISVSHSLKSYSDYLGYCAALLSQVNEKNVSCSSPNINVD